MRKKKNNTVPTLKTDWLLEEPIDFEHKKYILLSYFQKINKQLEENKIYPFFTEISLHLASLQTLIKEGVVLYTNKKFNSIDDEILIKDLMVKPMRQLNQNEIIEMEKIIKFSATKFFEFFSVIKSYWTIFYDSVSFSLRKNKKNINLGYGFVTLDLKDKTRNVWEYNINIINENTTEYKLNFNLIYSDKKDNLTINQILSNFTTLNDDELKKAPIFTVKTVNEYPLNETMLPIIKRKILTYIQQSVKIQNIKTI